MNKNKIIMLVFFLAIIGISVYIYNQDKQSCTPGNKICTGSLVQTCSNTGGNYVPTEICKTQCGLDGCNTQEANLLFGVHPTFSELYESQRKAANISDKYLLETRYYDYSALYNNKDIQQLFADMIAAKATPKEAAKMTARFVVSKVTYDLDYQTSDYCYSSSASKVLNVSRGVCSTMARVDIAILRGRGLAARAVAGCVKESVDCLPMRAFGSNKLIPPKKSGSRYVFGGYAHEWVEVWLPDTGWTIIEPTLGLLYPDSCLAYNVLTREDNFNTNIDECTLDESSYQECLRW